MYIFLDNFLAEALISAYTANMQYYMTIGLLYGFTLIIKVAIATISLKHIIQIMIFRLNISPSHLDMKRRLYYNSFTLKKGPVAQLGARINRTDEVEGSNPSRSTSESLPNQAGVEWDKSNKWAHGAAGSAPQWH